MALRCLGFCGVDEGVDVDLLTMIANRYPRSEFGVLFREDKESSPRYPSAAWVEGLAKASKGATPPLNLAAHLCGRRCTELLQTGDVSWIKEYLIPRGFQRIQINATKINGVDVQSATAAANLLAAIAKVDNVEWIIQVNFETTHLWESLAMGESVPSNVSLLFDASCGTGKVAQAYTPPPRNGIRCGYAGGLSPKTITAALSGVRGAVEVGKEVWLDMESGIRSQVDGVDQFDVAKVLAVCRAVEQAGWEDPRPAPESVPPPPLPPNAKVSYHPLLAHKLTLLRDVNTQPNEFRKLLRDITYHLGYEATADMITKKVSGVRTPVGPLPSDQASLLSESVALIPILRAGLGMVDAMQDLLPGAVVHHIGMFRAHGGSGQPIEYYSRLPRDGACDVAIVLEPMIATAQTMMATLAKLKGWKPGRIIVLSALCSRKGLDALQKAHPDVQIHAAMVDETLTEKGFIVPGLGDAGDRQFGTPAHQHPLSQGIYASSLDGKGRLRVVDSPKPPSSPSQNRDPRSPLHKPVTMVLGERCLKFDAEEIPEPDDADADQATQLTTFDGAYGPQPLSMVWGASTPEQRGPVLATIRHPIRRNVIGAHSGGYSIYRALAVVSENLDQAYYPKLGMTTPVAKIGPFAAWFDPKGIVTFDPFGHAISEAFGPWLEKGYDIRPTIAVTKAHIELPECREALVAGRLTADGNVLTKEGQSFVTKAAIEPVWYLPGIAERFNVTEKRLRESIFKETNSMYPELLTRNDLKIFLPPIGGLTVYIWGDPEKIPDESIELTVRVHDECNGSDVFGSDICTCRPYLTHAIEECIKTAQRGGTGVVVYFRKEGRALGEVTKYLVYNMRKRQEGGDKASEYFNCTKEVAGVTDTRFQVLMPDVLHWLGITKIHRFISMSDMKHDAIVDTGIKIVERVEIPPEMVPQDAQVEMAAKVFAGYHAGSSYTQALDKDQLDQVKGREYSAALNYEKSVTEGGGSVGTAQGKK